MTKNPKLRSTTATKVAVNKRLTSELLGFNLKWLRVKCEIPVAFLAKAIKKSDQQIYNIENGTNVPSVETASAIRVQFGFDPINATVESWKASKKKKASKPKRITMKKARKIVACAAEAIGSPGWADQVNPD